MGKTLIETAGYFDGERLHSDGPYSMLIEGGRYLEIERCCAQDFVRNHSLDATQVRHERFIMPPMAESHCHLFLDGDELDAKTRSTYLKGSREDMLKTAFRNVEAYRKAGVKVIRDAGDAHGINREVRDAFKASDMKILSAGIGLRRQRRYGSFMAAELERFESLHAAVRHVAQDSDTVKIILTGIIDFENGIVKDPPQFSAEECSEIVSAAHEMGLKTFAHCSGIDGLKVAVSAGVDSIEHGFFMTAEILEGMAQKGIAWCPTFMPVHFQWLHPEFCKWTEQTVEKLKGILANHAAQLRIAESIGVSIIAGSDGGSYGVPHGVGIRDELALMKAAGMSRDSVLKAATTAPREHFGLPSAGIVKGGPANFIALPSEPLPDFSALASRRLESFAAAS